MADDAILPILIKIQTDIAAIKETLSAMRSEIDGFRRELDGQFEMMASRNIGLEALTRLVAEHGRRLTALEKAR